MEESGSPRIAFCTTMFGGSGVGGHTFVEYLRAAKGRGELNIEFFATEPKAIGATRVKIPFIVRRLPAKWLTYSVFFSYTLVRQKRLHNFDIIWFNNSMLAATVCLFRRKSLKGVSVIGMINDNENSKATFSSSAAKPRKFWRFIEAMCAKRLDLVVVNSRWMGSQIAESYRLSDTKVKVLYKAVDITQYCREKEIGDASSGCTATRNVSGTNRQLGYMKTDPKTGGLSDMISAFALLPSNYELVVAGPEGDRLRPFKKQAIQLGVAERIVFKGRIPREGISAFFNSIDLFCNPALAEPLGVCMLEAMSMGVPIVARRAGGVEEVLAKGEAGWLYEGSPDQLAEKILDVFKDQIALEAKVVAGNKQVRNFTVRSMVERIKDLSDQQIKFTHSGRESRSEAHV